VAKKTAEVIEESWHMPDVRVGEFVIFRHTPEAPDLGRAIVLRVSPSSVDVVWLRDERLVPREGLRHVDDPLWKETERPVGQTGCWLLAPETVEARTTRELALQVPSLASRLEWLESKLTDVGVLAAVG
jgi:hypothetical protein